MQGGSPLTQAIFLDMFADPAVNPKRWPCRSVGLLASKFSDGPFGSNLKTEHYVESGVRVIRLQNIGNGKFIDDDVAYVAEEHFKRLAKHECRPGDVLIATLGDPNLRACVQPDSVPVALNKADCVQLRPQSGVACSAYVCALLNHPSTVRMAQGLMHGQTRIRVSMGQLRHLQVPVPPFELQLVFAARTASVGALRQRCTTAFSAMDALFASLQHRAFRGAL